MSGMDVLQALTRFGFTVVLQKGSHVKLRRTSKSGKKEILTIPLHTELDRGTLKAIYRQASAYIPEGELWPLFFTE